MVGQHLLLKAVSLAVVTPFYSVSIIESVQSDIASESPVTRLLADTCLELENPCLIQATLILILKGVYHLWLTSYPYLIGLGCFEKEKTLHAEMQLNPSQVNPVLTGGQTSKGSFALQNLGEHSLLNLWQVVAP